MNRLALLFALAFLGPSCGVQAAHTTTASPGCGTLPADIEFLLDTSGSVRQSNFDKVKAFVRKFVDSFDIGPNAVNVGVSTFDTHPRNEFWLNQHTTKPSLQTAISHIGYPGGNTGTGEALQFIRQNAFTKAHGDRDRVANILIVVTDGQSNNKQQTLQQAADLHKTNLNVFAVGVGSNLDHSELEAIASKPQNVFTVTNFDALDNLQATLAKTACEVNGNWSPWGSYSPCSKSCEGGTHYRTRTCTDPAPANGGADCHGSGRDSKACHTEACPTPAPVTTHTPVVVSTTPVPGCGVQPADIVFIVDASGSVGTSNFQKTLGFIQNMTRGLAIGPNDTQIGMITFDTKPYLQFHLNKFASKNDVLNAEAATTYTHGTTSTHLALKYATDTSFTAANGARPNAAHIAIVITDGKSGNPTATASQAQALRNKGVTVFSIGVGFGIQESELKAMATDPDNEHVFVVNNFDALNLIKGSLQQKTCEVKPTLSNVVPPQANTSCGGRADIVFLLDSSGSVGQDNYNKMLDFVKGVANNFQIGPQDVQIGVDTFATSFNSEFTLGQYGNSQNVESAVGRIPYIGGGTNTGPALSQMASNSFTTAAGHRAGVPKIAIVVTDGKSNNPHDTVVAAQKARDAGIQVLAIGVGSAVDDNELNAIASDPDSQNVYKAATFDSLTTLKGLLSAKACEQTQQVPQQKACGNKADIVFMLDSSGSVGSSNFQLLTSFVNSLTKDWDIGQDKIRVGVEKFSSRPYTEFHLNNFNDKQQMLTAINNVKYQSGGTNTGDALNYMRDTMFTAQNGDRPGVPNIGIIITDGKSNSPDQTKARAAAARAAGITLFSVGVGAGVSRPELNEMATDPDSSHVFTVDDFSKLAQIKTLFQQQTCDAIPASLPPYVPTAGPSNEPLVDTCQDHIPNCASYDPTSCTNFVRWAQDNCPRYCGFCSTAIPTTPPPCVDVLNNCASYAVSSCSAYKPWAMDNCRKYCGFCVGNTVGIGYYGKCFYKGQQYAQGAQWSDGCAYDCECTDAATGQYRCFNKCPTYYNLPPQCTLVQQSGQCCLQPVCNFDAKYQTTSGQHVGDLNGNKVCVYNGRKYYQSQTWTVGCDLECICDDAGVGLYACQSKCAYYGTLPANCKLVKPPGECCAKPECEFNTQVGTFTGKGQPSGPGDNGFETTPPPCVDKLSDCASFDPASCTSDAYRPWALENCRKTCNLCNTTDVPGPNDVCVYDGVAYKQGQQWDDGCDKTCVCENAAFGYYRCDNKCPQYYNMPPGCTLVPMAGQCCKAMRCDSGTITGSQTVPNTIGAIPVPYQVPTVAPGLMPGNTLAPGMTLPAYLTPAPGMTLPPGFVPGMTLAPGVTIPWYLTPRPGMTYAPTPFTTPAPLIPGQTLPPGQTIPPYITPAPGQTFAPGIVPGQTLAPGVTVPPYLTPRPGQTYAPQVTNPYATPAPLVPGQTLAPGQTLPPYITPAPGYTFAPGIVPGQTLAPGVTVPMYLTPRPGQTYAPGMTPPNTPYPLIPGVTLPPGQTLPPYITPAPGQTFAPGIVPGQTLAPGVTVPLYLTPRPGQTYAPSMTPPTVPLIPGITLPPGQTIPSYITPPPGQTFAPGIVPGQTLAPGVTVPVYLTPAPGYTYSPDTTPRYGYPIPGLIPGQTLAPGVTIPPYITPPPGQTFAPGIRPGQTLAPGITVPPNFTPAPGQTYAPMTTSYPIPGLRPGQTLAPGVTIPSYITPAPGQTFAPGIRPGQTLAPGVTVPVYLTPAPGQTYSPDTTHSPVPGIRPGQTLAPGQTLPPYITPAPGQTFAPGIRPGQTLAPGVTVPVYLTPAPGQTYAPAVTRPQQPGVIPGWTLAPGQTLPSYITPAPGQTFAPGIRPGQSLAPGVTVPINFTPAPYQTYAPDTTPGIRPGQTLAPGMTLPPYITPVPGQTFAPGIRPGQTLAPGVTVPINFTPAPYQTYAPYPHPGIRPGQTLAPGVTLPSYITPAPGQTFAPGIRPGQTLAPGVTVPVNLTPAPYQTYAPDTTQKPVPGIQPGQTLAPGQTLPPYITPVPGQTFAPGIRPGQTLAPGVTVPPNLTPAPGQTYAPAVTRYPVPGIQPGQTLAPGVTLPPYITPAPGQTFAPGIRPGQTLAPGVTVPPNLTPAPGQTYAPVVTRYPIPGIQPGQTLAPGVTLPSYITPAPGQTFAPGIRPGQTLAPGVTVPPNLTPYPGVTYAPGTTPGIQPGRTLAPGVTLPSYITPAPGQTFAPGIRPGQTLAPGVTVPLNLTPRPGQTYSPDTTPTPGSGYPIPGLRPGNTLAPGQTIPPYATPVPGQTFAPGIVPGQTLAPGVTLPWNFTPSPFQTYPPGTQAPPGAIIPGQTLAPGQTLPSYITPAPGQTFAPGILPGQTLAPGVTVPVYLTPAPGQTYSPYPTASVGGLVLGMTGGGPVPGTVGGQVPGMTGGTVGGQVPGMTGGTVGGQVPGMTGGNVGGQIPGLSGTSTPQKLSGCVYKSTLYQQGQRWTDGCDFACVCEDGSTGRYRCSPKCLAFNNLDPKCTLQDDPNDPCCKTPDCPPDVTVVPNIGQAVTGFSPAIYPNTGGVVGGVPGGATGGSGTVPGSGGATTAPISGQRVGCVYKGQVYQKGNTWKEGCQYTCECVDDVTGFYRCTDLCPNYQNLPPTCRLIPDPQNSCCQTYVCDVQVTTTQAPAGQGGVPTPAAGVAYCLYNGRYYQQGEEWDDGCSLKCRCEDAQNKYYQCSARCPTYTSVPLGCRMVPNPKDPQCCKMPECDSVTGQPGTGTSGSNTPLGFIGTFAGNGRPSGINVGNTGYRASCIYKGQIYPQGATWQDGCDLDCECTDAQNGIYRCTDRCQHYAALPSGCQLVQDPSDQCCVKADCPAVSSGVCRDVKDNCFSYGKYSCQAPYTAWAKDNCAYYCGFCGTQTTPDPANCQDKLPNCPDYGHDGCVGTYESWARYNCPKYCGYCGANSQVTTASSVIVVSGQPGQQVSGTCQDVLPICDQYGPASCNDPYRNWAIDNCPKRCNLCSQVGTNTGLVTASQSQGFTGQTIGCFYNGRIYGHGEQWQDGCDYNCTCVNGQTGYYRCGARCLTYNNLPQGCVLEKPAGECCSRPVCNGVPLTGQTTGCLYKGQVHPQGSEWNDGCDYRCTCQDGKTGQYQCTARCVQWNLPSACSLLQPAPGKCCPTPNCSSGFTINYPPGYVAE